MRQFCDENTKLTVLLNLMISKCFSQAASRTNSIEISIRFYEVRENSFFPFAKNLRTSKNRSDLDKVTIFLSQ